MALGTATGAEGREERPSAGPWRGGGIMTGERELPSREISPDGGEEGPTAGPSETERPGGAAAGVTKPTWRTLGSLTVREGRRGSIDRRLQSRRGDWELALLGFQSSSGDYPRDAVFGYDDGLTGYVSPPSLFLFSFFVCVLTQQKEEKKLGLDRYKIGPNKTKPKQPKSPNYPKFVALKLIKF